MKHFLKNKGLTLSEIIIAVAIMLLIMLSVLLICFNKIAAIQAENKIYQIKLLFETYPELNYDISTNITDTIIGKNITVTPSPAIIRKGNSKALEAITPITDESFICYGKIDGNGSIYTDGKSKFIMETNVAAGASGTALLSEKDIDIKLPASTASTINLTLTGVVMSHGNLNATILDANDPDNPTNVLGMSNWPSDWAAQANYITGSGDFTVDSSNPEKIIPMDPPPGKEGTTGWQMKITRGIICTDSLKFEAKSVSEQIDVTGGGSAPRGLVYLYDPTTSTWYGGPSTQRVWPSTLKKNGQGTYSDMSGYYFCNTYFDNDATKLQSHIYNTLNKYFGGSDGTIDPNIPIYPPNVSIIGALIVADPNNLDGSGSPNTASGNININLTTFNGNRGNFTIMHSKKYEKLLASPNVNSQLQVTCWEELH